MDSGKEGTAQLKLYYRYRFSLFFSQFQKRIIKKVLLGMIKISNACNCLVFLKQENMKE